MWRATFKSLLGRKLRLALTALSIVLGVGFVAGTFVLTDTMNKAFNDLFAQASKGSDVVVRATSAFTPSDSGGGGGGGGQQRDPIPQDLLATVRTVAGVKSADGSVSGYAQMVDPKTGKTIGGLGPPTFGANWNRTANATLEIRTGAPPTAAGQVVVDAATAKKFDLTVGQTIKILFEGPPAEFTIVGTAGFGTADNLGGATLALFDTSTAQQVLGKDGVFDEIDVVAEPAVTQTQLRALIADALPKGVEAVTSTSVADEQSKQLQDALGFFRTALLVFAFIALFVGAFIIFNTFSIIVAQRTRELALLRTLGASRRQVLTSVIAEAFVVGLVASALGIVAGLGIALGLKGLLSAFNIDLPTTSTQLQLRTIIVSFIVGTLVTVVASVLPARRAARVAPVQALRESQETGAIKVLGRRLAVGLAVTGLGAAALLYGLFGNSSNAGALIGLGAAATFVGIAILSPLAARPLAGIIGAPVSRMGVQGKLGRENAMRNPRRTASTASALMIGLGLVAMVAILSASLKASFDAILSDTVKADFILSTSSFVPFSPDVASKTSQVPGVAAVAEFRQGGFRVNGNTEFVSAVDPATVDSVMTLNVSSGSIASLSQGQVMIFDDVATKHHWSVGDTLPAAFATTGKTPLTIGGTYSEDRLAGDYLISLDTYQKYFPEQLDEFVMVKTDPGANAATVQRGIEAAAAQFGNVEVQDQTGFRDKYAGQVNQLLGLVTALLAMAILIALFGIINTLGLSIFERTRELGLLRAVGMSRRQVKRMIRWESVIIAILGAVLGLVIGVFFGWSLQQALADQGVTELRIPVGQLAGYLVFAGLAGVFAAIWPARRAAKLNVLEAISYE
ncbi:MAG: ABC transporter permease [Actinomycetota bacterium]